MMFFESQDKKIGNKLKFIAYYIKLEKVLNRFNIHFSYQPHHKVLHLFQFVGYFQQSYPLRY